MAQCRLFSTKEQPELCFPSASIMGLETPTSRGKLVVHNWRHTDRQALATPIIGRPGNRIWRLPQPVKLLCLLQDILVFRSSILFCRLVSVLPTCPKGSFQSPLKLKFFLSIQWVCKFQLFNTTRVLILLLQGVIDEINVPVLSSPSPHLQSLSMRRRPIRKKEPLFKPLITLLQRLQRYSVTPRGSIQYSYRRSDAQCLIPVPLREVRRLNGIK